MYYKVTYAKSYPAVTGPIKDRDEAIQKAKQFEQAGYEVSVYQYSSDGRCKVRPEYSSGIGFFEGTQPEGGTT